MCLESRLAGFVDPRMSNVLGKARRVTSGACNTRSYSTVPCHRNLSLDAPSMTTPSGNHVLCLEDSAPQSPQVPVAPNDENAVGASFDCDEKPKPNADPSPRTTPGKRQRTLF